MRKYLFMLLLCSLTVSAQDVHPDFQSFRQGTLKSYSGFRKSVLDDYAKYLQGVWDEYEQFRGAKRDNQPKPSVAPKAETEPQSVTPKPIEPEVSPSVLPEPAAPVVSKPVVPGRSSDLTFTFYGMKVKAIACKARTLGNGGRNEVASVWTAYQKDSSMKDAVVSLRIRLKSPQLVATHKAVYSDLDINGHVNSIRYLEMLIDHFTAEQLRATPIRRVEMAYCLEAYCGDTLDIYHDLDPKNPSRHLFEIRNAAAVVVRGSVQF